VRVALPGDSEGFAAEVARRMDGPVLRYSQRQSLLASALGRGIGRFQASLIIAAVQHERGDPRFTREAAGKRPGGWRMIGVIALTQLLTILGAWHVWRP
jgi:hypothetical protein